MPRPDPRLPAAFPAAPAAAPDLGRFGRPGRPLVGPRGLAGAAAGVPPSAGLASLADASSRAAASAPVGPAATAVPAGPRAPVRCDVVLAFGPGDEEFLPVSAEMTLNQNAADPVLHLVADGFDPGGYARALAREPNVRLYRNDAAVGPYVSLMRVFDRTETPFLAVQDADDVPLPNRLWDAVTTLERAGADLFGAAAEQFLDRRRARPDLARRLAAEPFHRSGVVWRHAPLGMCVNVTLVVRRAAFERLNGFAEPACGSDCEFNTRARAAGLKAVVSPHLHALRRLQARSLSHGPDYGEGTAERARIDAELLARYRRFVPGFDPRPFGALDRHRGGRGTVRLA